MIINDERNAIENTEESFSNLIIAITIHYSILVRVRIS